MRSADSTSLGAQGSNLAAEATIASRGTLTYPRHPIVAPAQ